MIMYHVHNEANLTQMPFGARMVIAENIIVVTVGISSVDTHSFMSVMCHANGDNPPHLGRAHILREIMPVFSALQVTCTIIKQTMRMCAEPTHSCATGPTPVVGIPTVCIRSATQNKSTVCDARFTRDWQARDRKECCLDATNYFEIVPVEFLMVA